MPFLRPTLSQLIERMEADVAAQFGEKVSTVRRSFLRILTRVLAGAIHLLYGFLEWNSKQLFPDTAEREFLERWASLYGLSRTPARYAEGFLSVSGTPGSLVPAGTQFQAADGTTFATLSQATLAAGMNALLVRATETGTAGNLPSGQSLQAVSAIAGMNSAATVGTEGLNGGVDRESDASLRARVLARLAEPPQGGAKRDYEQWTKEVPGVTRVWVKVPGDPGVMPGQVKVYFVKDSLDDIIPTQADLAEVQAHIDAVRPVTATVSVLAPTAFPVQMTVSVYPDSETVRNQVAAELRDLLSREGGPGETIFLSRIHEAISLAEGEERHVLVGPVADVTVPDGRVATLPTVIWVAP